MSDLAIHDLLNLDPDDASYEARLNELLGGTYNSGWVVLKMAASSSIMLATERTSMLIETVGRILQKLTSRAEARFVTDFNYDISLLGPCLSAVLLTSFSLEGFLRLGMYVSLESQRDRPRRRRGFDAAMVAQLTRFEALNIGEKITSLATALECRSLPSRDSRLAAARDLLAYRNECVHETPSITLAIGRFERVVTGKKSGSRRIQSKIGPYQRLSLANRPVRLTHVVEAVEAHDGVVRHFLTQMAGSRWKEDVKSLDASLGDGTLSTCLIGTIPWELVRRVAEAWEDGPQRTTTCSERESREFGLALRRKTRVKPVQ